MEASGKHFARHRRTPSADVRLQPRYRGQRVVAGHRRRSRHRSRSCRRPPAGVFASSLCGGTSVNRRQGLNAWPIPASPAWFLRRGVSAKGFFISDGRGSDKRNVDVNIGDGCRRYRGQRTNQLPPERCRRAPSALRPDGSQRHSWPEAIGSPPSPRDRRQLPYDF